LKTRVQNARKVGGGSSHVKEKFRPGDTKERKRVPKYMQNIIKLFKGTQKRAQGPGVAQALKTSKKESKRWVETEES